MTTDRRADADLRHDVASLLHRLGDRVQAGQVHRWQIVTGLGPLQLLANLLRVIPEADDVQKRRQAMKETAR